MSARHTRTPARPAARPGRRRLILLLLAPVLVLAPLSAWASSHTEHAAHLRHVSHAAAATPAQASVALKWARSWAPPLALLSNYTKAHQSKAGFLALPLSMVTSASQKAIATATFRTRWVDVKALTDGPNIVQQGLSIQPAQFKLQIEHSPRAIDHRGDCKIMGTTGFVLAFGPTIDVADGKWHTVTCIKFPDTATHTKVLVIVDGVAGKPAFSKTPIGNIVPSGLLRLGGRSTLASTDSLDGWIRHIAFWLS